MDLQKLGKEIKNQDNRFTDQPMFVVEQLEYVITDPDYGYDHSEWVDTESGDYEVASDRKAGRLDALEEGGRETGDWKKFYYKETWKFVTACFTEKGCKDFLKIQGHNLGKTRIFAYVSFSNFEFQDLRNHFLSLASDEKGE